MEGFEGETGFEDDESIFNSVIVDPDEIYEVKKKRYSIYGYMKTEFAYSYLNPDNTYGFYRDRKEFSKIRQILNLTLDLKLWENWKLKIGGNAFYDKALRNFEKEVELREFFFEGRLLPSLWLKTGRQIIAWGESEGNPIVDMINPRDNREFGQVDMEDRRIPLFATKLSYILPDWELNVVASH